MSFLPRIVNYVFFFWLYASIINSLALMFRDLPVCLVVKTSPSNAGSVGSVPDLKAKNPHVSWPKNQNIKQKQYCNKFNNKALKSGTDKKKNLKKWMFNKNQVISHNLLLSKNNLFPGTSLLFQLV